MKLTPVNDGESEKGQGTLKENAFPRDSRKTIAARERAIIALQKRGQSLTPISDSELSRMLNLDAAIV